MSEMFRPDMPTDEAYTVALDNLRELRDWAHARSRQDNRRGLKSAKYSQSAHLHEDHALYLFARVERMLEHGRWQERAMPRHVEPNLYIHPDQRGILGYRDRS
jgi:hypothetical protein